MMCVLHSLLNSNSTVAADVVVDGFSLCLPHGRQWLELRIQLGPGRGDMLTGLLGAELYAREHPDEVSS